MIGSVLGCLEWPLSPAAAGTDPVAVRCPNQKLVHPEGVTHDSPAAAPLGSAPTRLLFGKGAGPWSQTNPASTHTSTPLTVTSTGAVTDHLTVRNRPGDRRLISFAEHDRGEL